MPHVTTPIPETYISIVRPVVLSVVRQIRDITKVSDKGFRISYLGYPEEQQIFNSNTGTPEDPRDTSFFEQKGKFVITVREVPDELTLYNSPVMYQDTQLVFLDKALDVQLKPVYSSTEVNISFEYRTEDKQAAQAWVDEYRTKIAMNREALTHHVAYEYPIPFSFAGILQEIHRLRENKGAYGNSFAEYLMQNFSQKATVLVNMAGERPLLVIKEDQLNILGWFENTTPPEVEKGEKGANFMVRFDYKFRFEKPIQMALKYPFVIHNQVLGNKFRNHDEVAYHRMVGGMGLLNQSFEYFRKEQNQYDEALEGIRIPHYDDWIPKYVPIMSANIMTSVLLLNESDLTRAVQLTENPTYPLQQWVIDFLVADREKLTLPGASVFFVALYEGDDLLASDRYYVEEDLTVRTTFEMDLRKTYHLRFSVVADFTLMSEQARDTLRNHPETCLNVLKALDPSLESKGLLPKVVGGRLIPDRELRRTLSQMRRVELKYKLTPNTALSHVGQFVIVTRN